MTHHALLLNIFPLGDCVRLVHGGSVSLSLLDPPYKKHEGNTFVNRSSDALRNLELFQSVDAIVTATRHYRKTIRSQHPFDTHQ